MKKNSKRNLKTILISIITVTTLISFLTIGVFAFFSEEENTSAYLEAGTIDISIGNNYIDQQNPWRETYSLSLNEEKSDWTNVTIINQGTNPVKVHKTIEIINSTENINETNSSDKIIFKGCSSTWILITDPNQTPLEVIFFVYDEELNEIKRIEKIIHEEELEHIPGQSEFPLYKFDDLENNEQTKIIAVYMNQQLIHNTNICSENAKKDIKPSNLPSIVNYTLIYKKYDQNKKLIEEKTIYDSNTTLLEIEKKNLNLGTLKPMHSLKVYQKYQLKNNTITEGEINHKITFTANQINSINLNKYFNDTETTKTKIQIEKPNTYTEKETNQQNPPNNIEKTQNTTDNKEPINETTTSNKEPINETSNEPINETSNEELNETGLGGCFCCSEEDSELLIRDVCVFDFGLGSF
ncbi:MAG: M73 family secreted endopeptidase [Candidatus Methanohalarchaeum thermophilum]|uniref:M73 family secreted endopeptidase n=1 Tax=Methanohalarchaeum thermophilum TaxID=1903181 RepID=A0A1Q6DXI8_METT1|nr:MAG: M73 family secreted endopeptidase [Candidatus Methanohalarchaeum thermophilum]